MTHDYVKMQKENSNLKVQICEKMNKISDMKAK